MKTANLYVLYALRPRGKKKEKERSHTSAPPTLESTFECPSCRVHTYTAHAVCEMSNLVKAFMINTGSS